LLFLGSVFAAGQCYLNGEEVECPKFLDDFGGVIIIGIVLLFLVIAGVIIFFFAKAFLTGSVSPLLEKNLFTQGEEVKGKAIITLKKPIETEYGQVNLIGERETTRFSQGRTSREKQVIHKSSSSFVVQPSYPIGKSEAEFKLIIPNNALSIGKIDASALGGVGKAINFLQDVATPKTKWYIETELKTKSGLILSGRSQIQIQ